MNEQELKEIRQRAERADAVLLRISTLEEAITRVAAADAVAIQINLDPQRRILEVSRDGRDFKILAMRGEDQDLASGLRDAILERLAERKQSLAEQFAAL